MYRLGTKVGAKVFRRKFSTRPGSSASAAKDNAKSGLLVPFAITHLIVTSALIVFTAAKMETDEEFAKIMKSNAITSLLAEPFVLLGKKLPKEILDLAKNIPMTPSKSPTPKKETVSTIITIEEPASTVKSKKVDKERKRKEENQVEELLESELTVIIDQNNTIQTEEDVKLSGEIQAYISSTTDDSSTGTGTGTSKTAEESTDTLSESLLVSESYHVERPSVESSNQSTTTHTHSNQDLNHGNDKSYVDTYHHAHDLVKKVEDNLTHPHSHSHLSDSHNTTTLSKDHNHDTKAPTTTTTTTTTAATASDITPVTPVETVESNTLLPTVASEQLLKRLHSESLSTILEDQAIQSIVFRKEIEHSMLNDLQNLTSDQLRIRLIQLSTELLERSKWETIRLHQSIKQVEYDMIKKYDDLLLQQRIQLEQELLKKLAVKDEEYHSQLQIEIQKKQEFYHEELSKTLTQKEHEYNEKIAEKIYENTIDLQKDAEIEMNNQLALLRNQHVHTQLQNQENLESLSTQLNTFFHIVDQVSIQKNHSSDIHYYSAALLSLEKVLNSSNKSFKKEYEIIKKLSQQDPLISTVLTILPNDVLDTCTTPPSLQELRYRFRVVRKELRKEALAPPQLTGLISSAIGTTLAYIAPPPEGYVRGSGIEEILSRTNFYLELGMLDKAVHEMHALKGYSATLAADWMVLAKNRLVVEQAIKILNTNNILTHVAAAQSTSSLSSSSPSL